MSPHTTFALIDYDNAIVAKNERNIQDVRANLAILLNEVGLFVSSQVPSTRELIVRIYGGWITKNHEYTPRATWLISEIPNFRRRFGPFRVKPTLTDTILALPEINLCGTYRRNSNKEQQKMVDGMITVDMLFITEQYQAKIVLVSDDDDFVPALLYCARSKTKHGIFLKRKAVAETRLNDGSLLALNIKIGS